MKERAKERGNFSLRGMQGVALSQNSGLQQQKEEKSKGRKRKYARFHHCKLDLNQTSFQSEPFMQIFVQMDLQKGKASTKWLFKEERWKLWLQ